MQYLSGQTSLQKSQINTDSNIHWKHNCCLLCTTKTMHSIYTHLFLYWMMVYQWLAPHLSCGCCCRRRCRPGRWQVRGRWRRCRCDSWTPGSGPAPPAGCPSCPQRTSVRSWYLQPQDEKRLRNVVVIKQTKQMLKGFTSESQRWVDMV